MIGNLLANLPRELPAEQLETLLSGGSFKLERILSTGHTTPPGEWYDQAAAEWVFLLAGTARLEFTDTAALVDLQPGDHLLIPAHRKHRVAWTDPNQTTVWLALHFQPEATE